LHVVRVDFEIDNLMIGCVVKMLLMNVVVVIDV